MPKKPKPKSNAKPQRTRRVNVRALMILGGVLVVAGALYFPIRGQSNRALRRSALKQAEEIAARGETDLAIRHLDRYLMSWPDDVDALEAAARLRTDSARSINDVIQAASLNDRLLRLDPEGKQGREVKPGQEAAGRQETRRRLIKLWVAQSDAIRAQKSWDSTETTKTKDYRYRAAKAVADDLLARGADDAEAHRLMAMTLDGLFSSGDAKSTDPAIGEYAKALSRNPGDATSAERLAQIYLDNRKDPAAAERTLDDLLKAAPNSIEARSARFRYFTRANKLDRASEELAAAIALAPRDPELRIRGANEALRRKDLARARAQLDAIPEEFRDDPRVRVTRGYLELAEKHPDVAIDEWRKGLAAVGGSDQVITLELAYNLIQLDRFAEARPLVAQFRRLQGDDPRSVGRFLQGLLEQRSGHFSLAIDDLEKSRDKVPPEIRCELLLSLGICHEKLGDEARALAAYRASSEASPKDLRPRQAIVRLRQKSHPEQAAEEVDRMLAQAPDDPAILYEAGRLQFLTQLRLPAADRNWRRLEEILERAGGDEPRTLALRTLRADYLIATGRAAQGLDLFARAARGPERKGLEAWLNWALLLEGQGRLDEALKVLDEGSTPEAAGDHSRFRIARARILARTGRGQAARDALGRDLDRLPRGERPELAHALGDLLRDLGDRDAARASYVEWARLDPVSPDPGLALLALGQLLGDDEAYRLGNEILRTIGGDREAYGLATQAMDLLKADPAHPGPPTEDNLARAELILERLRREAPELPLGHQLQGALLEGRGRFEDAALEYRKALVDPRMTASLVRLIEIYTRLKRPEDLAWLRERFEGMAQVQGQGDASSAFDRIAATTALRLGDSARAEYLAAQIVEKLPDSLQARSELAQILDQVGKPKEAEATLRGLVDRLPNDPSAWVALVSFQALKGNPAEAAKTIDRARTTYQGPRLDLLLGRCDWVAGRLPEAAGHYSSALAKGPEDQVTLREVAQFDVSTGRLGRIDAILRQALKVSPSATWAARELAIRLSSGGDPAGWAEAWALVEPGSKTSGESPEDRLLRAMVLARCPEEARRSEAFPAMTSLAQDLPASSPVAIEARVRLGQAMLDSNRPGEAAAFIAPVADDERVANPTALALSAESLARAGRPDEAASRLERLERLEPKTPRTHATRAWVLQSRGQLDEAVAVIEAAVAEAESTPDGEAIGLAFFEMVRKFGRLDGMERLAARIAARWPRDAYLTAQVQLAKKQYGPALASARAALEAGSPREALRVGTALAVARHDDPAFLAEVAALADAARSQVPRSVDVVTLQATVRHIQGRYDEEIQLYREALALNPPTVLFLNNMAWTLSEGVGKPEEALARIDEAIKRSGKMTQFLDTRGVILSRLDRLPEAIADLELAAKADPSATTYYHLARACLKANRLEDHRRYRDLARKAKFDPATLDPTDQADLDEVMSKAP